MTNDFVKTELGLLPKDWYVMKLSRMIKDGIIIGHLDGNHGQLYPKREEFISEGVPYISANCIVNGKVDFKLSKYLSKNRAAKFKKGVALNNDVLFAHNATVGPVAHLKTDEDYVILGTSLTYYRCNVDKLVPEYLMYYMDSQMFRHQYERIMGQSTRNQVPISTQKDFKHVIPPLPEQKKIAKILSTVDGHIDEVDRMIEDLKELKKGLMQKLLTEGIGHTEFKDSEVGRIPVEWDVKKLYGCIHKVLDYRGRTPKKLGMDWGEGDIPALSANNVKMGKVDLTLPTYYGSEELHEKWMNDADLEFGDVLMTMEAPLGNVAQVPTNGKYILSQRVVAFKVKPIISNNYLRYLLMSPRFQKELELHSTGTTAKGINQKNLSKLYITVPPIGEQNRISTILSSVDLRLNVYEEQLEEFVDLKKGLMQQLLTGKTRVKIDN
ncbi:MAG: restriction endonuclease subunit S [Clostridia bacterium]|nr:restriction endonuclease subunit S [Clostridia bacterium]